MGGDPAGRAGVSRKRSGKAQPHTSPDEYLVLVRVVGFSILDDEV